MQIILFLQYNGTKVKHLEFESMPIFNYQTTLSLIKKNILRKSIFCTCVVLKENRAIIYILNSPKPLPSNKSIIRGEGVKKYVQRHFRTSQTNILIIDDQCSSV